MNEAIVQRMSAEIQMDHGYRQLDSHRHSNRSRLPRAFQTWQCIFSAECTSLQRAPVDILPAAQFTHLRCDMISMG